MEDRLEVSKIENHGPLPQFNHLVKDLFVPLYKIAHDKAPRSSKTISKEQTINRFISQWRQQVGDDIYPAARSILAHKDKIMYHMKEDRFIQIVSKVAHIKKKSDDWKSLKRWKTRNQNKVQAERGFEDIAANIVMSKGMCSSTGGTVSLKAFNTYLDQLATTTDKEKVPIIKELCGQMNYDETRFFFRIIMKRNPMGGMEKYFLYAWNPDMSKLLSLTNNLQYAFSKLAKKDERLGNDDRIVQLWKPFTPERSERMRKSYDEIASVFNNNFYIEEKYDGERFQVHMERQDDNLIHYKFFTRSANEYSLLYGESSTSPGCLSPFITNAFKSSLKSCILDGEMISYDPIRKKPLPFSTVKSAALDMFSEQTGEIESSECYPMFVIFDILLCNGISVENKTLEERKRLLKGAICNPVPTRFEIGGYKRCTKGKEIEEALSKAIKNDSEGIMVKDPKSRYSVGTVSKDWVKVKPEYLEEFGENLDLMIVGKIPAMKTTYVCALRNYNNNEDTNTEENSEGDDTDNDDDDGNMASSLLTDADCKFITLCKVANGFSADDYKKIESQTSGKWKSIANLPPKELIEFGTFLPESWIDPRDAVVIEVKSRSVNSQLRVTDYAVGCTLVNAYCVKIREDKTWKEASTLGEFTEKSESHKHRTAAHTVQGAKVKKLRLTQKQHIQNTLNSNNTADVIVTSQLFSGITFYVVSDYLLGKERYSISAISKIVKAHGGTISKNIQSFDVERAHLIILSQKLTREAERLSNEGYDIMSFKWLFDCILVNQLLPAEPSHCFKVSSPKWLIAETNVDQYGDSYAVPIKADDLSLMLEQMPSVQRASDLQKLPFKSLFFNVFCDVKFFIVQSLHSFNTGLLKTRIEIYNGSVVDRLEDCTIVVADTEREQEQILKKVDDIRSTLSTYGTETLIPRIVNTQFVYQSIEEGILVDPTAFRVI